MKKNYFLLVSIVPALCMQLSDEQVRTFKAAQVIKAAMNTIAQTAQAQDKPVIVFDFDAAPNFAVNHTAQGIILTTERGFPHSLCTPWGEAWLTRVSGTSPDWLLGKLRETAQLRVISRSTYIENSIATINDDYHYAVQEIKGVKLPFPRRAREDVDVKQVRDTWNALNAAREDAQ